MHRIDEISKIFFTDSRNFMKAQIRSADWIECACREAIIGIEGNFAIEGW